MADLVSPSWPLYCSALLGLTVAYLLITSTSQYLRLRHIPGPPLAAWTNFWLMRHMHHKDNFHVIRKRLHQEYGPIQRYGPNRVMFSDPTAIPIILGWTSVFIKVTYCPYGLTAQLTTHPGLKPRPHQSVQQRPRNPHIHRRDRRCPRRTTEAQLAPRLLAHRRPSIRIARRSHRHRTSNPPARRRPHRQSHRLGHMVRIRHRGARRLQRRSGLYALADRRRLRS
jgi:hypothetical protein